MSGPIRNVLVALESSGPGGAENMVVSLASELAARGHRATIVTDRPGWMTERAEQAAIPVWIETQRPGVDLLWILRLAWRMRRARIDVFHSHEFSMNVFGGAAARLAGVPHLATIHGRHYVTGAPRRVMAYRMLRRTGVPIVAVSEDLRGFLAEGFRLPRSDLAMIPNGIGIPPLPSPATREERARQRERLGLPAGVPLVLCVGNLYPVKDHASLVRALPKLAGVHVAIAGRGAEEANLRRLASELDVADRVHLLGLRDDVPALLEACDVFAQPSRSEGLPLAILEAMSRALPVVASRVGGIPEAIEDGRCGSLTPPDDPEALARALGSLFADPARAADLGRAARARVESEFSVATMVDRYLAAYPRLRR